MTTLHVIDLGRRSYQEALDLQMTLRERVKASEVELAYLVTVEHNPPVVTLGRGADRANVVSGPEILAAAGVELHETGRGGDVTWHGPGQLVGYPILRVDHHGRDVHRYLRDLEEVLISVLARFGLQGQRKVGLTGVWVGQEKVAAIGIAVSRWVSYHGFALNVEPDIEQFGHIVPCGIADKGVTSMARLLGRSVSVQDVSPVVIECMVERFGFDGWRDEKRLKG